MGKEYQSTLLLLILLQRKRYPLSKFFKLPESITGDIHRAYKIYRVALNCQASEGNGE